MIFFFYDAKKKAKKNAKDKGFPSLKDMAIWRDFKPPHVMKNIWALISSM
jgi:hypothetical protein